MLDPKRELAQTAGLRRALGHDVYVLDPFAPEETPSACFNGLSELDPDSATIVDDAAAITQALIVSDGDSRAQHWNDSARALLLGIILLTLTLAAGERHLVTVRELLSLTYAPLLKAVRAKKRPPQDGALDEDYFDENKQGMLTLLRAMAKAEGRFGGILAAIGHRFLATPVTERGSIFSTAAAQTDFLDSLPLRRDFASVGFSPRDAARRPADDDLPVPAGWAHGIALSLAAARRADGLHGARTYGYLSA